MSQEGRNKSMEYARVMEKVKEKLEVREKEKARERERNGGERGEEGGEREEEAGARVGESGERTEEKEKLEVFEEEKGEGREKNGEGTSNSLGLPKEGLKRKPSPLRRCAREECSRHESTPCEFQVCRQCKDDYKAFDKSFERSFYCSFECYKIDWKRRHQQFHEELLH